VDLVAELGAEALPAVPVLSFSGSSIDTIGYDATRSA